MNTRGVTLVELLIVIVVMGIIAFFSGTMIENIILNSKEESFINTANVMISSASTAYNQNEALWDDNIATLQELIDNEYMEVSLVDPWGTQYDTTNSYVTVEIVLQRSTGEIFLSNVMHLATTQIFRVKLISGTATLGFDTPLQEFNNDDVIYINGEGSFITGIIENITGSLNSEISGDDNNDSITVENNANRNARINTFDGDDSITVNGDMIAAAEINSGDGNDTINVGKIRGRSSIDSGAGNDILVVTEVRYLTTILAGEGNDTLDINIFTTNYRGTIHMGSGDDILTINDSSAIFRINGTMNGGSGNDTLNLPGVSTARWDEVSSMFSNFEIINLSDSTITD
jgi:prepilin-type N-terminal cleavage/methylation domain-containing protein